LLRFLYKYKKKSLVKIFLKQNNESKSVIHLLYKLIPSIMATQKSNSKPQPKQAAPKQANKATKTTPKKK